MEPDKPKQLRKKKYNFGQMLLEELLQSGTTLVTGPFYYTAFLFEQFERQLREKVSQSGEITESFTDIQVDFSSLGIPEYCIDLSFFDALREYNQSEMKQWEQAGFDPQELERLRDEYLYGEVWKKEDEYIENAQHYNRSFTISIITSLSFDLAELITDIAKSNVVSLLTVISIFYGLLFDPHNKLKLMVLNTSESETIPQVYFDIANKIHEIWEEIISVMALSISIERLWVDTCLYNTEIEHPMKLVRSFLLKGSYHPCIEDSIQRLSDEKLKMYLDDRFMPIENSYDALVVTLADYWKRKGKSIAYKTGEDAVSEEFSLGIAISGKFLENLFLHNYHLHESIKTISAYQFKMFSRKAIDIVSKANAERRKSSGKLSIRSEKRYKEEFSEEFKLKLKEESEHKSKEEIENGFIEEIKSNKKKSMRHARDGFYSQNQLIKIVFMDTESTWHNDLLSQGIIIPEIAESSFKRRLKLLLKSGDLVPDDVDQKTKTKYYRRTLERIRQIGELVTLAGRKKGKSK